MSDSSPAPRLAAILPVRGTPALLQGCLDALTAQELPIDEIIVVDDDPNPTLQLPDPVKVLQSGGAGPYVARNTGWRLSSADIVLFLDVRSRPAPQWSRRLVECFEDPQVQLAGTEVRVTGGDRLAERAAVLAQSFRMDIYVRKPFFRPYLPTCNMAVRRRALEAVDGFPVVRSGGDAEVCWRILGAGSDGIVALDDVLVEWVPRVRVRDFLEQHYRYGKSNFDLRERWRAQGMPGREPLPAKTIAARGALTALRFGYASLRRKPGRQAEVLADAAFLANHVGFGRRARAAR